LSIDELIKLTATEQRKALLDKKLSGRAVEAYYNQIEKVDSTIGAYNSLTKECAMETATQVDAKILSNEPLPPLAGIPITLKDNMNVFSYPTTASSKILENFISPYDATVTKKIKENFMPIIGKANLDEFAMGSSNENSAFKIVRNPGISIKFLAAALAALQQQLHLTRLHWPWVLILAEVSDFLQVIAE
jgi:aspartyl-tRNA(Asn)/glutamyl-tRNA(Gln) amidotransferase subunit A